MSAFTKYVRSTLEQAGEEAQLERATTIEAQHVLLAIAVQPELPAAQVLKAVGLDHRAIRDALDREFEHSLSAAGVSLEAFALPRPASAPEPATQLGASVKNALERGVAGVRKSKDLRPAHLLLGILLAEVGTVPRALTLAGIDRADLMLRLRQTLASEGES
jgi:ATP-dependent Clp protease ATP-binding subunit ClpA